METTKKINLVNYIHGAAQIKDDTLKIDLYNSLEKVGDIEVNIEKFRQMNINSIYCLDRYRRNGIGTYLMDLTEYMLKDYNNYTLYGAYCPYQAPFEKEPRTRAELALAASEFYLKRGFSIITLDEFKSELKTCPDITLKNFDLTIESYGNAIVCKHIDSYNGDRFYEDSGIIKEKVIKK